MTQNCFCSQERLFRNLGDWKTSSQVRAGVGVGIMPGRISAETRYAVCFLRQVNDTSFICNYNNRYIAHCQVIISDMSLFFYCKRSYCVV